VIYMCVRDHGPPHVHAGAAEHRAVVDTRLEEIADFALAWALNPVGGEL
jgi:hypothetical protein